MLNKACRRLNRPAMTLGEDALAAITAHDWPGNVRELENTIERAVILADNDTVSVEDLALPGTSRDPDNANADLSLEEYFRAFVRSHEGHLTETELARRLGISRKALWQKRQRLGLPRPRQAG